MYLSKNKERKLIDLYPSMDDGEISRVLGVSLWAIRKRAEELGLEKEDEKSWSAGDMKKLHDSYPTTANDILAKNLGKSKLEIEHFAFRMGLSKDPDFFSNIVITSEEKELLKQWNDEYSIKENGSSRGNFVLDKILQCVFPHSQIMSEFPIGNLRLDLYVPNVHLGFEVDGIQHKEHIEFFHKTKGDFNRALNRDYNKSEMCEKMGIGIVRFSHNETLSISLAREKIKEVI